MSTNHSISRHSLARFLAASVVLHLCLLAMFNQPLPMVSQRQLGQSVLDVQLQDDLRSPAPEPASTTAAGSPSIKTEGAQAAVLAEATADAPPSISVADVEPRTSDPAEVGAGLRNQLLGELKTRLSYYLTYPSLARDRGWEGTVLLGLRIETDGRLDKIRVERGSGYAVLDHSAVNSLNRLRRLAEASAWLDGRSVDMQLPITYRLIEN